MIHISLNCISQIKLKLIISLRYKDGEIYMCFINPRLVFISVHIQLRVWYVQEMYIKETETSSFFVLKNQ